LLTVQIILDDHHWVAASLHEFESSIPPNLGNAITTWPNRLRACWGEETWALFYCLL
jgi:hypothetical protein